MANQSRIERQRTKQAWIAWIDQQRETLKSIGLPPEVYLDHDHWEDFLDNGNLEWHPESSTGFHFSELSQHQMHHLLRFLETTDEFRPESARMRSWLPAWLDRNSEM